MLLSIATAGGGIWNSVLNSREADDDLLTELTVAAFDRILSEGTTTVEAKSGYGQTLDHELRMLTVIADAARESQLDVVSTFLGAHVVPAGMTADDYVAEINETMMPAVARQGIARFCDITCEEGYFDEAQAASMIRVAGEYGYPTRIHADNWNRSGGWPLAVEMGARTADHVTCTTSEEIRASRGADTFAVLVPAAETVYFSKRRANASLLIENDIPVVIATDYCSSIPVHSLRFAMGLGAAWFEIPPDACIAAATLNAAYSLGMQQDVGSLDVGKQADILILECEHPYQMIWELGQTPVHSVIKRGTVVV